MYLKILQLLRDRLLVFEYFSHLPDLIRTPPFILIFANFNLRDRPFLFPGTRAERIYENLQKILIPHENAIDIFRTPPIFAPPVYPELKMAGP